MARRVDRVDQEARDMAQMALAGLAAHEKNCGDRWSLVLRQWEKTDTSVEVMHTRVSQLKRYVMSALMALAGMLLPVVYSAALWLAERP